MSEYDNGYVNEARYNNPLLSPTDRVMIFIDGSNFEGMLRGCHTPNGIRINKSKFQSLINFLSRGRKLIRTYLIASSVDCNELRSFFREVKFALENYYQQNEDDCEFDQMWQRDPALYLDMRALNMVEYFTQMNAKVILKRRGIEDTSGRVKDEKGVDMALAMEALIHCHNNSYDTAIILSGDGDFVQLVEEIQRRGKRVEIASSFKSISYNLKLAADWITFLDKPLSDIYSEGEAPVEYLKGLSADNP